MTPEQYFYQVYQLDKLVEDKRSERKAIRDTVLRATTWEDNPSFSNQFHSTTESAVMKLIDHSERVNEQIDELVDLKIQIAKELDQLDKRTHKMVLREHYLAGKQFDEIAVEQNYTKRYLYELRDSAFIEFKKKFSSKFK